MDGDSDGDEFYDAAAEFQPSRQDVELDDHDELLRTKPQSSPRPIKSVDETSVHLTDHGTQEKSCGADTTDGGERSERSEQDKHKSRPPNINKTEQCQAESSDNINEDKVLVATDQVTVILNGRQPNEETGGNKQGNETENIQNDASVSPPPVAPPRRKKKKNKGRPKPVVDVDVPIHDDIKLDIHKENGESVTQVKNDDVATMKSFDQEKLVNDDAESVDPDLDISTQEMSEILDRNNYTEVISPPHVPVHLQRNKSQSISSIGSFCSVSSNISFQDRMKRSGSQGSLGSAGNEKVTTADQLTDEQILEQVVVKNLDTGECIPLSEAEQHVPTGVNPLALHIMRLTSEFASKHDISSDKEDTADGNETLRKISRKKKHLRGLFGRKVQKTKTTKDGTKRTDDSSSSDDDNPQNPDSYIKIKSANSKGFPIINKLSFIQDLSGQHQGAVWTMKFSCCGKLLATAGQDKVVHVWVIKSEKEYFQQIRAKYAKADKERPASPSSENLVDEGTTSEETKDECRVDTDYPEGFCKEPFCSYVGHIGDVLDLSWSKNYFLLSSSMDKTVRLWHISRNECLCCFQHIDFVTAITFHPRDDRYFLSGSLDGKIRLWNIPDKKVALWNELEGAGSNLITAANFCVNGKFAVVGTYDGRCIFYETEHLKYFTQWQVRSTRKKQGRKISGIEPMPGEDKILITSNDSRIRLYSLKDHSLHCKYKGFTNSSSQIKGSFSHDGEYVICGSEDHFIYMWRAQHRIPSSRKDRNDFYESFSAHNAVVTTAIFAPCPWNVVPTEYEETSAGGSGPEVIVSADWTGSIKIFVNKYQNVTS